MKTKIFRLNTDDYNQAIEEAAGAIRRGGTVVFPTETVYGLGADALNEDAVKKIFEAKNRPQDNPLIVHISEKNQIGMLAEEVSKEAGKLVDRFFPGPLTLVMKKSEAVPDAVSHGLDTVGIRMPSNRHANAFIRECKTPIAAPSANISKRPSITSDKYLVEELDGRVDVILLAGDSEIGVESTVLDVSGDELKLLRPGKISIEEIEQTTGKKVYGYSSADASKPKSPGMKYAHYRPKTELTVLTGDRNAIAGFLNEKADENIGFMGFDETVEKLDERIVSMSLGENIEDASKRLYYLLREMDEKKVKMIYAEGFSGAGLAMAYMNRLLKASGGKEIKL